MSKVIHQYVCQACGTSSPKWSGKCVGCGAWNSLEEEIISKERFSFQKKGKTYDHKTLDIVPLVAQEENPQRVFSECEEFDRVIGGGLVPGSVLLIGGDPGIGKSTLLLQIADRLARLQNKGLKGCIYVSGEEGKAQIRLRADRLSIKESPLTLAVATQVQEILTLFEQEAPPSFIIVDSIQTLYVEGIDAAPGTVTQVRTSAHEIIQAAKQKNVTVFFIGHVTKEGAIAGPKILEHMVDTVLYFEGEKGHPYRILRSVKNRFGPTNEIGVFEMNERGLQEVKNPSDLFLPSHEQPVSGISIFASLEGTRPLLMEVQALVIPIPYGTPRRTTIGWDLGRLVMLLAVLEARCGYTFSNKDVYVSIAGGLKVTEPAADLAIVAAILSAFHNEALPIDTVFLGEIGLSGDVRRVYGEEIRLKEAQKLGFRKAYIPKGKKETLTHQGISLQLQEVDSIKDLLGVFQKIKKQ